MFASMTRHLRYLHKVMTEEAKSDIVVLDLETKKSFEEVKGRNSELMGVSVVCIYSYKDDKFLTFFENETERLASYLQQAKLVVGFNVKRFDFSVLQPYLKFDLSKLNVLDIFEEVQKTLGFRLSLNNIAQATLGVGKSGTGLDALKYFRNGEMDKLAEYCQRDVFVTREVYEYGKKQGHLIYRRGVSLETIPAVWAECKPLKEVIQEAYKKYLSVEIVYSTFSTGKKHTRLIDIYAFDFGRVIAYCHLKKALRIFNIRRILSAKLTQEKYAIPSEFDLQEFKAAQKFSNK